MTNVFLTFLGISATVGAAVLLIQLISPFINRRYAAKWKYLIWIFLAVRLLVPVSGIYQRKQPEEKPTESLPSQTHTSPAESDGETIYVQQPQRFVVEIPVQAVEKIATQPKKSRPAVSLLDAAVMLWLAGAAAFAGVHIVSYVLCTRRIKRHGKIITEGSVYELMQSLRTELGVRSKIALVRYPEAASPMIIGFVKPLLVLPDDTIDDSELYFIIRHELIHQKRHDVYAKLLSVLANAVHWFNPIIWLMRREIAIDMELSCDEGVVRGADFGTKRAYTETLMSSLSRQTLQRSSLTTQFYGGKSTMKKRFANILNDRKKRSGIVLLILTVMLTTMLGALVGCTQKASLPSDGELGQMIYKYLEYESYAGYDNPAVDFERPYSDDPEDAGYWSYPVIEEGLTTWQDWLDYLGGIFTEKGVEAALKQTEDRYVNYDGNLYYRDGSMGWTLSGTFSIARVEQTADKAFTVEFWREYDPSFTDGDAREFLITVLDFEYTRDGWRIADHSDRDSMPEDSHPNLTEFKPFGDFQAPADEDETSDYVRLTDEKVKSLVRNYLLYERFTRYDSLNYSTSNPDDRVLLGDDYYYPVTEDGLTTYQEWNDFVRGIFTDEVADEYLKQQFDVEKRYANIDGKLYTLDAGGMGWYLYNPCQVGYKEIDSGAVVEFWQEYFDEGSEGTYRVTVFNLKSTESGWKIESCNCYESYSDYDGYTPMLEKPSNSSSLSDEEMNRLLSEYLRFDSYTNSGMIKVDWQDAERRITKNGFDYCPSAEEGLTTWQEWSDFLNGIFDSDLADTWLKLYSEGIMRYIDIDGKLYARDWAMGVHYGEPCQAGSKMYSSWAEIEYWQEALFEGEAGNYLITVLTIEFTDTGWKITNTESHVYPGSDGFVPMLEKPTESTQPSNNDDSAESIEAVPTIVNNESESLAEIPGISKLIDEQFKDYIVYGGMYYTNVSEEPSWSATDFAVGEKLMEINEISSNRRLAELKDGTSSLLAVGTEIFKCENRLEILLARAGDTYVPYCKMVEG